MSRTPWLPGVHATPNLQDAPETYELENRAADPEGLIWEALDEIHPWEDQLVVDLGAGSGFHVPRFAQRARHVYAVEPHGPSRLLAMERLLRLGLTNASVLIGSAEHTGLQSDSMDLVVARFAYFWGPGCEQGLQEVDRILRPGGALIVVDNDLQQGTFAQWLQRAYPRDRGAVESFWRSKGFQARTVATCWRFQRREELEAVVHNEFRDHAPVLLDQHTGLEIQVGLRLFWRCFD
ncbi:MAG: class I SAM-dependent methyltransferase [Myxococcota bacterium]|nr:class I SAM-dependent methyltransferase [Myxococcota bacterium]